MCFRVGPRSPVTSKTKLFVVTVNSSLQLLPIFCHKELHYRYCTGLELNIVISMKILKSYQGSPPMIECNLGKI